MKLPPVNVLVIFYSCCGETERLALAAAVGAVQARASIRMRRLTDSGEDIPECKETLARMRREYVPPTQADTLWADLVIVGMNGTVAGVVDNPVDATAWGKKNSLGYALIQGWLVRMVEAADCSDNADSQSVSSAQSVA